MKIYLRRIEEAVLGGVNMALHWMPARVDYPRQSPRVSTFNPKVPAVIKVQDQSGVKGCQEAIKLIQSDNHLDFKNKSVLIKPNYNSPHPYPATSDPLVLTWLIKWLQDQGARQVVVGESSGAPWWPTRKVLEKLGVLELVRKSGAELVLFEEDDQWVRVSTQGKYFPEVILPASVYAADLVIYLALLKSHRYARLSGALKLGVGLLHPAQRKSLHISNIEGKTVDINLGFAPDLIICDCREAFVTEGPTIGEKVKPGLILASTNQVALDYEGVLLLQGYEARNLLNASPRKLPFLEYALSTRLAPRGKAYEVLTPKGQKIRRELGV